MSRITELLERIKELEEKVSHILEMQLGNSMRIESLEVSVEKILKTMEELSK
jgi:uncharacterized coiled-coil protein SlyX